MCRQFSAAVLAAVLACVSTAQAVVIQTVRVGNPGNVGELSGWGAGGLGPDRSCGAVNYVYNIGKFEVSAGQYTEFLNAVASTDTFGLYNPGMDTDVADYGCQITQNGTSGNFTYDFSGRPSGTEADWLDRPVNYVSWGDAARFANWLHNGQPTGAQDLTTTEDGSYYLNGATSHPELLVVVREPDATWVIPSEDEWYKAAYHLNDGVTNNYYDYPTSSDSLPVSEACPGGNNSANYFDPDSEAITEVGPPYHRSPVGCYIGSASPYGTSDQGGNVWEWNESVIGTSRCLRGGSFLYYHVRPLHAAVRSSSPELDYDYGNGFRVVKVSAQTTVPAVSDWGMGILILLLLTGIAIKFARRGPANKAA